MNTPLFFFAASLFVLLTAGLLIVVLAGYRTALRRAGLSVARRGPCVRNLALGLGAWLLVCALLASSGALLQWQALPPRLLLVLLPPLLFLVWLCRSAAVGRLLDHLPPAFLIYPQAFRILMEIILWMLFLAGVLPVQMTFEGRNFDILVGLTAPLVAWFGLTRGSWPRPALIAWHVLSLGLLLNIVTVAMLSAPTPMRAFWNEPANTVIAYWPFVWLPGFVVPVAYILHALSLRQLLRQPAPAPGRLGLQHG